MNEHGLTKENLLRSLPISLSGDPKTAALAEAIAGMLAKRLEKINRGSIYPHINGLDERLLDILARDFKVDWWDSDYSLEEKRWTLAGSAQKISVEIKPDAPWPTAKPDAKVNRDCFQYGGGVFRETAQALESQRVFHS